jgi:P-type Ca2+ transporter type 2C
LNWHLLPISEAQERLAKYGPNVLQEKKRKPAWLMLLGQFKDVMILMLVAAPPSSLDWSAN